MAQSFKETAHNNVDPKKFGDNLDRIKNLSQALKRRISFAGEEITLEAFCRSHKDKFESCFQNQLNQELADQMALVYQYIITEGN